MGIKSLYHRICDSRVFQRLLRILQFLSAVISLGLFSERLYHVYRLVQRTRASAGGVETVLALATAYTLSELALNLCLKKRGMPNFLRWLLVLCDILFIGGFIAVAYETRPHGGLSSLCATPNQRQDPANRGNPLCSLTLATFGLAIFSTVLHLLTALFHEVKDHKNNKQAQKDMEENSNNSY